MHYLYRAQKMHYLYRAQKMHYLYSLLCGRIIAKLTPTFILLNMYGQGVFRAASVFPEACRSLVIET